MADGAFASGAGVGIYSRDGTTFTIHFLVNMQDGTQNLDEVVFDAYTRDLTHDRVRGPVIPTVLAIRRLPGQFEYRSIGVGCDGVTRLAQLENHGRFQIRSAQPLPHLLSQSAAATMLQDFHQIWSRETARSYARSC